MGKAPGAESHWLADEPEIWFDETVGRLLARRAAETPDAPVVHTIDDEGVLVTWSYRTLYERSVVAAGRVLDIVEPGAAVALCAPNSLEWLVAEFASAIAGTALVPIHPAVSDTELDHILTTCTAGLVIGVQSFRGEALLERLGASADRVPTRPRVVDLLELAADGPLPDGVEVFDDPSATMLVQFTSGTTGRPKGAVLTHEAALNSGGTMHLGQGATPGDVYATPVPFYHIAGAALMLGTVAVGSSLAFVREYDPAIVIELMETTGATLFGGVPTMLYDVQRQPGFEPSRISTLRVMSGGGSAVSESTVRNIEAAFGIDFVVVYGQSESPVMLQTRLGDPVRIKATTIGRPLPNREVKIVDPADGSTVATGTAGEICMRGPTRMTEYLAMPDETAATIDRDGWLHTGDLGSMDDHGNVTFRGRLRDVIIRGGENIYPDQVEAAYAGYPGLAALVVVGMPDERYGEVPVGVVVLEDGHELDGDALERHGREHLSSFQVPRRWVAVNELPMTASGKVRKVELRNRVASG